MKRTLISIGLCTLVLLAGVAAVALALMWDGAAKEAEAAKTNDDTRVPNVKVMIVEPTTLADKLTLTGTLEPWEEVMVSAETAGKIEWKGVEEGEAVSMAQELFRIDTQTIRAQLAQAQAQAKLAEQELGRTERLVTNGATTAQNLDNAVANRDVAAANLRLLEVQLAKSVVKAPISGLVDRTLKEEGEFVDTGAPLARLVQVDRIKVRVAIPERDIVDFEEGETVHVRMDALPGRDFEGLIHRIDTTADMVTHTFGTEVALDNADGALRPGMIARVTLVRHEFPNSIMVPIFATILLDEDRYAVVEKDGVAELRKIETGVISGSEVQVLAGLESGDRLVVSGQYDVQPGQKVNVKGVEQ